MKKGVFVFLFFLSFSTFSQHLNWVEFSDLNDSLKVNPKKVILKIETNWCGYCKMMEVKVFNSKKTRKKLNNKYYFVKLNAESKTPIIFRNREYHGSPLKRGKHELAIELNGADNQLVYPTTILLSSNLEIEKRLSGYLKRSHFFLWLNK